MRLKPPHPSLLRVQHSIMAVTVFVLIAAAMVLVTPGGRRATANIDQCGASPEAASLDLPLPHVAQALADGTPVTIIAFGSSSTYGTGASGPDKTYPSRLGALLALRFPKSQITVLNRGVGGEVATSTYERIDRDVLADHPTLVIWQVGTNDVLHDVDPATTAEVIRAGVRQMKDAGIDVVLMDVQFAPAILQHPHFRETERVIAAEAHALDVPVIHRFAMMREWADDGRMPLSTMLARDRLHMTDTSYDCLARQVGRAIVVAARHTRS